MPFPHTSHPDVHPAAKKWSDDQVLHVAAAYSNPFRWRARRELANDFRRHMAQSANVELHFVELAYGDRPFEASGFDVDGALMAQDLQLRTQSELFHKECLLNLAIRGFPSDWRYGAIIDADFHFTRHDWALETVHQLQHYEWVQLFSSIQDLAGETVRGHGHMPINGPRRSFMKTYFDNGHRIARGLTPAGMPYPYPYPGDEGVGDVGAPGGAWAFRRSAFDAVGGLLDRCILGSGDWFMAFGLVGDPGTFQFVNQYTDDYKRYIASWQERAASLRKNVGYLDCHVVHGFHGRKTDRAYGTRDKILVGNQYSPTSDVYPDWQGVLQLSPNKPKLRDEIRRYFLTRCEDLAFEG